MNIIGLKKKNQGLSILIIIIELNEFYDNI